MRNEFLPFCRPSITVEEAKAVTEVLLSGWITTGKWNAAFEERLSEYTGAKHAVALSSATAGMHLVLMALGIKPGDEVITPSLTWVSTVNMIVLAGATPVFADVDRDTLMVTGETVEKCVTPKTRLIIPVHYAGAAADMDSINAVAKKHGIKVVEDAAHALGTFYRGRHIGRENTAIYSFHPIKNITTGEGGMVTTNDPALAEKIRRLKFHGLEADAFDRKEQGRPAGAEVIEAGYKYNLTDIAAVLGVKQLEKINKIIAKRTGTALALRKNLEGVEGILPLKDPAYDFIHSWNLFIVRIVSGRVSRDRFMEELKKLNIGTGLHFFAAHRHKYYREQMPSAEKTLPNTEWNSDRICSLPLFPGMSEQDVEDVVKAVKKVLRKAG